MMGYDLTKALAKRLGAYRAARWVNRHLLNREELTRRIADKAFYRQILRPGDLAFDVGANYGEKASALLAAGARVVAFEPQPDCFAELRSRCGSNRRLTAVCEAVGPSEGVATLYVRRHRGTSGFVRTWEGPIEAEISVKVTTLERSMERYGRPTFVKIDVEGFELEVLRGLHEPVPYLSFEYHMRDDGAAQAAACVSYLSGLGRLRVNFCPAEELRFVFTDWIPGDQFDRIFPQEVKRAPGCAAYGDVFVNMFPR